MALVRAELVAEAVSAADYLVLVADEKMQLAAFSDAVCDFLGFSAEELAGMSVTDLVIEMDTAAHLYEQFLASGRQRGRIALRRKDGTIVEAEYEAHETRMAGLPYYVSVLLPG